MTTGPGSMPPKIALRARRGPGPGGERQRDQARPRAIGDLRPPHEQVDDEARGGSDRARRDREIAAVADGREQDGEASHALTTRVSASRSCSARRSWPKNAGRNPRPDRQGGHEVAGGADDRLAEGHALGRGGRGIGRNDPDARRHLPDRLAARGDERRQVAAVQQHEERHERRHRQREHLARTSGRRSCSVKYTTSEVDARRRARGRSGRRRGARPPARRRAPASRDGRVRPTAAGAGSWIDGQVRRVEREARLGIAVDASGFAPRLWPRGGAARPARSAGRRAARAAWRPASPAAHPDRRRRREERQIGRGVQREVRERTERLGAVLNRQVASRGRSSASEKS